MFERGFPSIDNNSEELSRFKSKKRKLLKRKNPSCCEGCSDGKSCSGKRSRKNPSCCVSCAKGKCCGSRRNPDPFSTLYPEKGLFARKNPKKSKRSKSHCQECALDCHCSPGYVCTTCTDHQENIYYSKLTSKPKKSLRKLADEILEEDEYLRNPDPFSTLYPEKGLFARKKRNPDPFSTLYPEKGLFARNPEEQTAWCEKCGVEIPGTITGLCVSCKEQESRSNPDPFSTLYPERGLFARRKLKRKNPDPFSTLYPERGLFARKNPSSLNRHPHKKVFCRLLERIKYQRELLYSALSGAAGSANQSEYRVFLEELNYMGLISGFDRNNSDSWSQVRLTPAGEQILNDCKRQNPDPFSTLYPERGLFARRRNPDPFSTLYPEKGLFARRRKSRLRHRRHRNPDLVFNTLYPEGGGWTKPLFRNPLKWKHSVGQRVRRKWDKKWGEMPAYYREGRISSQIEGADNRGKKKPGYTVGWKDKLDDSVSRAPWLESELEAYRRNPIFEEDEDSNAVACNEVCLASYQEDRDHGLIYGPYILNGKFVSPEEFSKVTGHCIYCGVNTANTKKFATRPDWARRRIRRKF